MDHVLLGRVLLVWMPFIKNLKPSKSRRLEIVPNR